MKFAQYLQDTQTPEWKKAYIDYRGLKKRITAIRKAQQGLNVHVSSESPDEEPELPNAPRPSDVGTDDIRSLHEIDGPTSFDYGHEHSLSLDKPTSLFGQDNEQAGDSNKPLPARFQRRPSAAGRRSFTLPSLRTRAAKTLSTRLSIGVGAGGSGAGSSARHPTPLTALPLHELLTHLSPHEVSFFTMLDAQLDKVESFYLAREKEMLSRGELLQVQLKELDEHRKLFLETNANPPWTSGIATKLRSLLGIYPTKLIRTETWDSHRVTAASFKPSTASISRPTEAHVVHNARVDSDLTRTEGGSSSALNVPSSTLAPISGNRQPSITPTRNPRGEDNNSINNNGTDPEDARSPSSDSSDPLMESTVIPNSANSDNGKSHVYSSHMPGVPISADPDSYLYAKRKLKRAVIEYYRWHNG
ncbi:SPX domain-containing protein [Panaeolus papilionaceus]|nr:SPX domain-containing protein [Panaeolus papilionaceus]